MRVWTDVERAAVHRVLTTGGTIRGAASEIGVGVHLVRKLVSELSLTPFGEVRRQTVDRMRDLAAEGWASSRIARRLGVNVEVVDHFLGRTPV